MSTYVVDAETGCWIWQGSCDPTGYTRHLVNGRYVSARRWHYEQQNGPLPGGLRLMIRCGNHLCVNPEHLEAVSLRDALREMSPKKLDEAKVREIRALAGHLPQRVIAEQFGIGLAHVNQIIRGHLWGDGDAEATPLAYRRHFGRLTFAEAECIRDLAQIMMRKDIATLFGVSESTVSLIVSGKRWAKPHVSTVTPPEPAPEPHVPEG